MTQEEDWALKSRTEKTWAQRAPSAPHSSVAKPVTWEEVSADGAGGWLPRTPWAFFLLLPPLPCPSTPLWSRVKGNGPVLFEDGFGVPLGFLVLKLSYVYAPGEL